MEKLPDLTDATIDNLVKMKNFRSDIIRRFRSRQKLEVSNLRQNIWNVAAGINQQSPATKFLIKQKLTRDDFPDHISLIPDGNRRWAKNRDLRVGKGYGYGAQVIKGFEKWAMIDNDVDIITTFLLSTENIMRRPEDELEQLYDVFEQFFNKIAENQIIHDNRIRHEVRGNKDSMQMLPNRVLDAIEKMERATEGYNEHHMVFMLPYGARDDIVSAARETPTGITRHGQIAVSSEGEDETEFRENLTVGDLPDVDLLIRTSEERISNFMLYENAYSEIYFLKNNWPATTESDFYQAIYSYANRERRYGV